METEDTTLRISVIIPVYNNAEYIGQAIESVLSQSYPVQEIIVIDDGSIDNSFAAAMEYAPQVRCFRQENSGPASARNLGVTKTTGDLYAFLDADDLWTNEKLLHQVQILQADSHIDMVFGCVEEFVQQTNSVEAVPGYIPRKTDGIVPGTMLIRRRSFESVGLFSTSWQVGEFIDWYGRALDNGMKQIILDEIVLRRRVHDTNLTRLVKLPAHDYLSILKTRLDRQRKVTV